MNIFIEGLQGMGKSTLMEKLAQKYPIYHVYKEGDYCPIELAWCSYMTKEEYDLAMSLFAELREEIAGHTTREEEKYIVEYTKIRPAPREFYQHMEQYEIYNGRRSKEEFRNIVLKRYRTLPTDNEGNLFECAFFQNIVEDMILFQQMSDEEIVAFYRELFTLVKDKDFRLYYLYGENIEETISQISTERVDENGNQIWFQLVLEYLENSPYGKANGLRGLEGFVEHLKHRQELEMRIIQGILGNHATILPAREYGDII